MKNNDIITTCTQEKQKNSSRVLVTVGRLVMQPLKWISGGRPKALTGNFVTFRYAVPVIP